MDKGYAKWREFSPKSIDDDIRSYENINSTLRQMSKIMGKRFGTKGFERIP